MGDSTGTVTLPSNAPSRSATSDPHSCGHCKYEPKPTGPLGLSRDTWARIVLWFVPIIFSAGMLFFSFHNMDGRVDANTGAIKTMGEKQQEMYTEQKVQANTLQTIKQTQAETKSKVERVGEKIDDQTDDLAAIKAKLKIKEDDV